MQIVGLNDWGTENPPRPAHPPVPDVGDLSEVLLETDVVSYIKKMVMSDPASFWDIVNRAMTVNGVAERDQRYLKDWPNFILGLTRMYPRLRTMSKPAWPRRCSMAS